MLIIIIMLMQLEESDEEPEVESIKPPPPNKISWEEYISAPTDRYSTCMLNLV